MFSETQLVFFRQINIGHLPGSAAVPATHWPGRRRFQRGPWRGPGVGTDDLRRHWTRSVLWRRRSQQWTACNREQCHYCDVIMSAMASQITSVSMVFSTVCSGPDQRKHQSSASLAFVQGMVTGEFPSQRASNAEYGSIWWRHHVVE